jgi:hypothetical protein
MSHIGITLDLIPDQTSVPRGGNLTVTVTLTNKSTKEVKYDGWVDVTLPSGQSYPGNPIVGPASITLTPGQTRQLQLNHHIPSNAPLGNYKYEGFYGLDHDLLAATDSFQFTVTSVNID